MDNAEPLEGGDWEMVTTERALRIGWELAQGQTMTTVDVSRRFGVDRKTAWRILLAAERVLSVSACVAEDANPGTFDRFVWRKFD